MELKGLLHALGAGWISGAAGILATHPIDSVRTRMQANAARGSSSAVQAFRELYRGIGFRGLFYGVIPPVIVRGVSFSVQRGTMYVGISTLDSGCSPATRAWLRKWSLDQAICGSFAGLATVVTDTPMYLLKSRAQASKSLGTHSETLGGYVRSVRNQCQHFGGGLKGLRSLYLGSGTVSIIKFGSWGLLYWLYDVFRQAGMSPLLAGSASGLLSWPMFYPFDVLRTQIQTASGSGAPRQSVAAHYRRFFAQPTLKWYPGLSLTLIRTVPRFGITFYVLESFK